LGGDERSFFSDRTFGYSEELEVDDSIEIGHLVRMLTDFCVSFGWSTNQVVKHTIHQLKQYSRQIAVRLFEERRLSLYIQRAAFVADRDDVDRFIESIRPREQFSLSKSNVEIPEGIEYKQEI